MSEPSDKELLEFVCRFAGWTNLHGEPLSQHSPKSIVVLAGNCLGFDDNSWVPDYLNSVDAWLRDVMPAVRKLEMGIQKRMHHIIVEQLCDGVLWTWECYAKDRCLALYRALNATTKGGES